MDLYLFESLSAGDVVTMYVPMFCPLLYRFYRLYVFPYSCNTEFLFYTYKVHKPKDTAGPRHRLAWSLQFSIWHQMYSEVLLYSFLYSRMKNIKICVLSLIVIPSCRSRHQPVMKLGSFLFILFHQLTEKYRKPNSHN
jgi:hypothetical protein